MHVTIYTHLSWVLYMNKLQEVWNLRNRMNLLRKGTSLGDNAGNIFTKTEPGKGGKKKGKKTRKGLWSVCKYK